MVKFSERYSEVSQGKAESFIPTIRLKAGGIEGEGYMTLTSTSEKMLKLNSKDAQGSLTFCSEFKEVVNQRTGEIDYIAVFNNTTIKNIVAVSLEANIDLPFAEVGKVGAVDNDADKTIIQAIPLFELAMAMNKDNGVFIDSISVLQKIKAKLVELGNIYHFRMANSATPIMLLLNTTKGLEYIGVFFYRLGVSTKISMQRAGVTSLFNTVEGLAYNLGFSTYKYEAPILNSKNKRQVSVCNTKLLPVGNISNYEIFDGEDNIKYNIQEIWNEGLDNYTLWAERRVSSFKIYFSDILVNNNIERLLRRNEKVLNLEEGSLSVNSGMILENKTNVLEIASKKAVDDVTFTIDDND